MAEDGSPQFCEHGLMVVYNDCHQCHKEDRYSEFLEFSLRLGQEKLDRINEDKRLLRIKARDA